VTAPPDYQLVRLLQSRVADRLMALDGYTGGAGPLGWAPSPETRERARQVISTVVGEHLRELSDRGERLPAAGYDARLRRAIFASIFGAGELQEHLENPNTEDVFVDGPDEVFVVTADGCKHRAGPVAASEEDLIDIVMNLARYAGLNPRPFSPAHPVLRLRLPDGSRLAAIMTATEHVTISIRRNRYPTMMLTPARAVAAAKAGVRGPDGGRPPDLLSLGTLTEEVGEFLAAALPARCNMVIGGAFGAGKTTLLRAMTHELPPAERIFTIESALELDVHRDKRLHADAVAMEETPPDDAGRGGISMGELVRATRHHRPSRVLIGEVMGPEAMDMITAMSHGGDGSLSTIHARNAEDVLSKLATYCAEHAAVSFEVASRLIAGTIDLVIYVEDNPRYHGRTVTEIREVAGTSGSWVTSSQIFAPSESDGRAVRTAEIPMTRRLADRLARVGYHDRPAMAGGW
jgi:Flp pilus assembly CpaF family ATPase